MRYSRSVFGLGVLAAVALAGEGGDDGKFVDCAYQTSNCCGQRSTLCRLEGPPPALCWENRQVRSLWWECLSTSWPSPPYPRCEEHISNENPIYCMEVWRSAEPRWSCGLCDCTVYVGRACQIPNSIDKGGIDCNGR